MFRRAPIPLALVAAGLTAVPTARAAGPPGVVIHHQPASSGLYIGSPSICRLPDGAYLASHDFFGPKSGEHQRASGRVYRSEDRGATWKPVAEPDGWFWTGLFVHGGKPYALGTDAHHGRLVIRRSDDGGRHWTEPRGARTGLLAEAPWHTAPMPVIHHDGRLWRAVEDADGGTRWGQRYRARLMSAAIDDDLLDAASWTLSEPLQRDPAWGEGNGWLEGNAVLTPDGGLVDVMRVDLPQVPELAAILRFDPTSNRLRFDPASDFVPMPGAAKKFTVRKDPGGPGYWALASIVSPEDRSDRRPDQIRNTLALLHSPDLRQWETRRVLLHHPDPVHHGFQYADWLIEEDDLVAVVRTAFDDDEGGAHRAHDANYLTFHRWKNFRAPAAEP